MLNYNKAIDFFPLLFCIKIGLADTDEKKKFYNNL